MLLVKPIWFLYTQPAEHHKGEHHALLEEKDDEIEMSAHAKKDHPPSKEGDEKSKHDANHYEYHDDHKGKKEPRPEVKNELEGSQVDLIEYCEAGESESHDFSEVFIHQLIETIEFVLGTVSNTASYLRLWALSLAHSQLAAVFYEKLLAGIALECNDGKGSSILLFLLFPAFFSFTFFVLMCMDAMECFLHCLRLHWVEFQNKFYKGNGYKFNSFSYERVLDDHNASA
jgi:hypothetical protein